MPDWTKKNFDDLRDVSPEGVHIQWRFAREVLGSPELGVSRFTYEPGARMPWGHRQREFERVLQSGIEDLRYARRIALLRGYYLNEAPELTPYLLSVLEQRQTDLPQPPPDAGVNQHRLQVQGLWGGAWQGYRTVAGMVAVITAVLAGSAIGLLTAIVSAHSLPAALAAGGAAAVATLAALMRYQASAWKRSASMQSMSDQGEVPESAPNRS